MGVKECVSVFLLLGIAAVTLAQKPTLYEHFTSGGINSGLEANNRNTFVLNGKDLKIFGGSLHYFRVHPDLWRDRLRKYRAAGLNAIDVYVPWNLHEPERGVFDFGDGGRDFSIFLDLPRFLQTAKEEDLLVIFRPGPYICAEWEFGGLPSWLLHEHPMFVRSSHAEYQDRVAIYLREVVSRVRDLQFYTAGGGANNGGPIIMVQIENEFGSFGYSDWPRDVPHLRFIKETFEAEGIESLLFTSDGVAGNRDWGNVDGVLMTANFKWGSVDNLNALVELQPNRPILVSEFWPGWFDHWFEDIHNTLSVDDFATILGDIFSYEGSVNFYMFHGGTNFGFMNGGNMGSLGLAYAPDVTSYDYDAPLSEAGTYTPKYDRAEQMIAAYDPLSSTLFRPARPTLIPAVSYGSVLLMEFIDYNNIIENIPPTHRVFSQQLLSMEQLPINNGNGQSYGYIVYRKQVNLREGSRIQIRGRVRDLLQLMVNGKMMNDPIVSYYDLANKFGSFNVLDSYIDLSGVPACNPTCTLDLFVENLGRGNFGYPHEFDQRKGIWEGDVLIDGVAVNGWEIISAEFTGSFVQGLQGWQPYIRPDRMDYGPRVLRGSLFIPGANPHADTYVDLGCAGECEDWMHGAVFVNGFNIGRYFSAGPQKTLYVPGPLLRQGDNQIVVVENYRGSDVLHFTDTPNYGPT